MLYTLMPGVFYGLPSFNLFSVESRTGVLHGAGGEVAAHGDGIVAERASGCVEEGNHRAVPVSSHPDGLTS